MSFLDNLNKQAQDIQQKEIEEETTTIATVGADVKQQNALILNDILSFIDDYFTKLANNLNVIKPVNEMKYYMMGKGGPDISIDQIRKNNFQVQEGGSVNGKRVVFRYNLYSPSGLSVKIKVTSQLTDLRKHLKKYNIEYFETGPEGKIMTLTLVNPVTSRFIYAADLDNCRIVLNLDNYDRPGPQLISYTPDKINEDLLDETAKFILGESNKFSEMSEYYL